MIELAIKEAIKNPIKPKGRNSISRFASILTNGRQIFIGRNSYKSHPLQAKYGVCQEAISVHSAIDVLCKAIRWAAGIAGGHYKDVRDLSNFKLYVARVLKDGSPANSKPCEGCMDALRDFGITQMEWID